MRLSARFASAAAVVAIIGGLTVTPAAALDLPLVGDCTAPPAPESPAEGVTAFLDPGPENPRVGDPFPDHGPATATIYDTYGWAGYRWVNYDLGCGTDAARDPNAVGAGGLANWSMTGLRFLAAANTAILRYAYQPEKITPALDPVGQVLTHATHTMWARLFGFGVAACGLLLLWRAHRNQVRTTAHDASMVLLITVAVAFAVAWSASAGPLLDKAITSTVAMAGDAAADVTPGPDGTTAGDALASTITEAVLYETWVAGNFGRTDSPVVDKYGPALFEASTLTRAEAAKVDKDPSAAKAIWERKQARFREIAGHIKAEDPGAYQYLAGHKNDDRIGYSLLGWLVLLVVLPLALLGGLAVILGVVVFRLVLWLLPLLAIVAVIPAFRAVFQDAMELAVTAVLRALLFGSAALLCTIAAGTIMSPTSGAHPLVAVGILAAFDVAAWTFLLRWGRRATKPWRDHGKRKDGKKPEADSKPGGAVKSAAKAAAKAAATGTVAGAAAGAAQAAAARTMTGAAATGPLRSNPWTGGSHMATPFPTGHGTGVAPTPGPASTGVNHGKPRITVLVQDLPSDAPRDRGRAVSHQQSPAALNPGRSVVGTDPSPTVYRSGSKPKALTAAPESDGVHQIYRGSEQ